MAQYTAPESVRVGSGVETVFGFNWPYLVASDINVTVAGLPVPTLLVGTQQVLISPAPAAGAVVRIYRSTPAQAPAYEFANGLPFLPKYVDGNNKQVLHALQEGLLEFNQVEDTAEQAVATANQAANDAARAVSGVNRALRIPANENGVPELPPAAQRAGHALGFDTLGNPIVTALGAGSAGELAMQLAGPQGLGMIGYKLDMVGAVVRSAISCLNERFVNIKDFGAVGDGVYHPLSEVYGSVAAAQFHYASITITSLAQSLDWAAGAAALATGNIVWAPRGHYILTDGWSLNNDTQATAGIVGAGVDMWEQLTPHIPNKNDIGTHFMMYGTGAKTRTMYGITDNAVSGGAFANPDTTNPLDARHSLTTFHNSDAASGQASTLRKFSAAIYIAPASRNIVLQGFRVHPYFDGIAGYMDRTTNGLGADWDVGICNDNATDVWIEDVQSVGYWRIAGMFQACVSRPGVQGAGYHCRYNRVNFQGRVGFLLRGGDTYRMLARTATTLDIPWQASHPFPTSGGFNTNQGNIMFTSCSRVDGTPFGSVLRFHGITQDTSGVTQVRIASGWGIGGTTITNFVITGLDHASGKKASHPDIGLGISTALEISGGFRQPFFSLGYVQSIEEATLHTHNIDDLRFIGVQFEANGKRGRMIASPQDINNTRVPYANGSTSVTLIGCHMAGGDEMPLVSRTVTGSTCTGDGFWQPRRIYNQDRQYPDSDQLDIAAMLGQNIRAILSPSGRFIVRNSANSDLMTVSEISGSLTLNTGQLTFASAGPGWLNATDGFNFRTGGQVRWQITSGHSLSPGADAQYNLAGAANRVNNSFFAVAPTVSSDERIKTDIDAVPDVVLDAWADVQFYLYRLKAAHGLKGADARWHAGVVAQRVRDAFGKAGLDPFEYGVLCWDVWGAVGATYNEEGELLTPARDAGELYSIRYDEALVLEAALGRRTAARNAAELSALHDRLGRLETLLLN